MKNIYWSAVFGVLTLAVGATASAQPRIPPQNSASPMEVSLLPKYCWAQHVDGAYFGHPIYSIPNVCGPYTNHFCGGLVLLMRASDFSKPKAQRRENLRIGADAIEYTLKYIKPTCPIYTDAQAARMRAERLRDILR